MTAVREHLKHTLSPTEGHRNGNKGTADDHHHEARAPGPPHLPSEDEASEEQHRDCDDIRKPQSERHFVDEEERRGNWKEAEKDEQEDAKGGPIVFPPEPGLEALGWHAAEMDADALEVGGGQSRQDGRWEMIGNDGAAGGGAFGLADRLDRRGRQLALAARAHQVHDGIDDGPGKIATQHPNEN